MNKPTQNSEQSSSYTSERLKEKALEKVGKEEIFTICNALTSKQVTPTIERVKNILGRGSEVLLSKYIKEYLQVREKAEMAAIGKRKRGRVLESIIDQFEQAVRSDFINEINETKLTAQNKSRELEEQVIQLDKYVSELDSLHGELSKQKQIMANLVNENQEKKELLKEKEDKITSLYQFKIKSEYLEKSLQELMEENAKLKVRVQERQTEIEKLRERAINAERQLDLLRN